MDGELKLRSGRLHSRTLEGETLAVDTVTSTYLSFNRTATELWPLLAAGTTQGDMVEHLVSRFGVDRARAEQDVAAFVAGLQREDLLEP